MGANNSSVASQVPDEFLRIEEKLKDNGQGKAGLYLTAELLTKAKYKNPSAYKEFLRSDVLSKEDIENYWLPLLRPTVSSSSSPLTMASKNFSNQSSEDNESSSSSEDEEEMGQRKAGRLENLGGNTIKVTWSQVPNKNLRDGGFEVYDTDDNDESSNDSEPDSPHTNTVMETNSQSDCSNPSNVDSLRTDGSRDYDLSDEKDRPQRLVKKRSHHGAKMLTFIATTGKKKSKKKNMKQCFTCKKLFSSRSNLKRHEKIHNEQRPRVNCTMKGCNKDFVDNGALKDHVRFVHGQNKLRCEVCKNLFANRGCLQKHMQRKHP